MNLSQEEIVAFQQLKVTHHGLDNINKYLCEANIYTEPKTNTYSLCLLILLAMFAYAWYFNSIKISYLTALCTLILPIIGHITALSNINDTCYIDNKVQLNKPNIIRLFGSILKHRYKETGPVRWIKRYHSFGFLIIIVCLIYFEHLAILALYVVLIIVFFMHINKKLKHIEKIFINAINKY
mgnify:CR=1 FL=1